MFRDYAPEYIAAGIPVFPVRPNKVPMVKNWHRIGCPAAMKLAQATRFTRAGIGMECGWRSGLTVIDLDEPGDTALARAVERFGVTPVIARTQSGKHHLYFRFNGERRQIRIGGEPIDICGTGGFIVLPPSIGEHGQYEFIRGGIDELRSRNRLPTLNAGSIASRSEHCDTQASCGGQTLCRRVREGERDNALFRACLRRAATADSLQQIEESALALNAEFDPPLPAAQARKNALQAWKYKQRGTLLVPGGNSAVVVCEPELDEFSGKPHEHFLLLKIRAAHGAEPGKDFALGIRAVKTILGCGAYNATAAIRGLIARGKIERIHQGGRRKGDASLYRLRA